MIIFSGKIIHPRPDLQHTDTECESYAKMPTCALQGGNFACPHEKIGSAAIRVWGRMLQEQAAYRRVSGWRREAYFSRAFRPDDCIIRLAEPYVLV